MQPTVETLLLGSRLQIALMCLRGLLLRLTPLRMAVLLSLMGPRGRCGCVGGYLGAALYGKLYLILGTCTWSTVTSLPS